MPNRILKESICTSTTLDALSAEEERFFYRLLVRCDDFGRFEAHPRVLRAACFPLKIDEVTDADIERWLARLVEVGLVEVYDVGGRRYLHVVTWQKHQQRRAQNPKYPGPEEGTPVSLAVKSSDINCNQPQSASSACTRGIEFEESRSEESGDIPSLRSGDAGAASSPSPKPRRVRERKTLPETDEALRYWCDAFLRETGRPYLIVHGRDRKVLNGVVATYGLDEARRLVDAYWLLRKRDPRSPPARVKADVPGFAAVVTDLIARKEVAAVGKGGLRGGAQPPPDRDFRDLYVR